jgi:pSer/pThr/pTyr-binding forkhead associated (FHA) protein
MPSARLKFNERELTLNRNVTTLGRATDTDVSFPEDSNISRYHAEIEERFGEYWLIDLQSSNGTTVNGNSVTTEVLLQEGDQILLGGSSELLFTFKEDEPEEKKDEADKADADLDTPEAAAAADSTAQAKAADEAGKSSKLPLLFGLAGLTFGLAIVVVIGAVLFSSQIGLTSSSGCEAKAVITKPETGDTIAKTVDVELETENDDCAVSAVFNIDGKEFAKVEDKPFKAQIDPAKFATLSDGFEHNLSVVLFDEEGNQIAQPGEVALVFETQEIESPESDETPDDETIAQQKPTPTPKSAGSDVSAIDTKTFSENILKQFSTGATYKFDPEFLKEVQKKTSEFASEGYFARASVYKDVINEAFIKEQNLDPALGYILAMSRTQFKLQADAAGEGLWRMPNEFVETNGYNQLCGDNKSLSDPSQICAAKASSLYLKGLVIGVFDGDIIYSVAAFGKTPQAAIAWKSTLPADRTDFWNAIKTPREREQIVRFFAAAVVAQNPQKFGLKNDRPISELYGFILQK